jgi:DNA modification methylase
LSDGRVPAREDAITIFQHFILTSTALEVRGTPDFTLWQRAGARLDRLHGSLMWWLGDWVRYGEARFGEQHRAVLEATGYKYQTIANAKWVASRIDCSRRRETLSFGHHAEVAALDPAAQSSWLTAAEREGWSLRTLRHRLAAAHTPLPTVPEHAPPFAAAQISHNGAALQLTGDARHRLRDLATASVHCCVTSPPYWRLRDYGHPDQLGQESTPEAYTAALVAVFSEVRRVLRDDGTLWLNLGDAYSGRNLLGLPWRTAFALQAAGWSLRQDIIWHKPNAMPESVSDRPSRNHEYLFLFANSEHYYYDAAAIREAASMNRWGGAAYRPAASGKHHHENVRGLARPRNVFGDGTRNKPSVWSVPTTSFPGAHFAVFPAALIEPCILAGSPEGGTVLDPFAGTGTTGLVALRLGRRYIGIDLNPAYVEMAVSRLSALGEAPLGATTSGNLEPVRTEDGLSSLSVHGGSPAPEMREQCRS